MLFINVRPTIQIEAVRIDLSILKQGMQNLRQRVNDSEQRISDVEDVVTPMCNQMRDVKKASSLCNT